ncbi:hypothetical protein HAX54_006246, partial [Datura stramonium]|nr:hypothetical protein [Datura stramonium]
RTVGPKEKQTDENTIGHRGCILPCLSFELHCDNLFHIYVFAIPDACYQDCDLNESMCCVFGGDNTGAYKIKPHSCFKFDMMMMNNAFLYCPLQLTHNNGFGNPTKLIIFVFQFPFEVSTLTHRTNPINRVDLFWGGVNFLALY